MEMEKFDPIALWNSLTPDQQLDLVSKNERDVRDALVYIGELEPGVTPALEPEELEKMKAWRR
jgi:hypothetical protein